MEELELQQKKDELIARIPLLEPIHSPNYEEVMDQMNTLVWEEMEDPMTMAPGASCKTASGVYNIFATDAANGLAKEQLMMHEAGHCVLQHFKDNWYKDMQASRQIKSKWPKFREHIEMEGNEEDEISESFIHMIRNITQDLEINGKYWPDPKDFEDVRERISDASLVRFITNANEEQLESIEKWMDEKPDEIHQFGRGVYPADFGFPNGLTWMGYLHLILTQPNEFMEKLNEQVDEMQRQQAQQQQQQGQNGQQQQGGQSGQQGQSQGQGQGSSQGGSQAGGQQSSGGQQGGNSQGGQQGNNSQQQNDGLNEDQTSIFDHKSKDGEGGNNGQDGQNGNQQGQSGNNGNQQGQDGQNGNGKDQNGNGKNGDKEQDEAGKGGKSKVKGDGKGKPQQGNGNDGNGNKMKASVIKANAQNGDKGNEIAQAMAQAAEDRKNAENGQQGAVAASGSGGDDADDWSAPGDGESTNLVDATPTMRLDRSVLKFIEKNCIGKTVQRDRQDPLYNYNRGKTSGGVMRTRITTVEEYRPGNLVALIDVSGSVDIELVKALLSEILKYKSKFGTKSRIILWDTRLVDDLPLKRSNLEAICCGGGTSIARGIRYAKEKYLKSEQDKLCVISDFEDCLGDWAEELAEVKGETFAVCWGGFDGGKALVNAASTKREEIAAQKMKVINVR